MDSILFEKYVVRQKKFHLVSDESLDKYYFWIISAGVKRELWYFDLSLPLFLNQSICLRLRQPCPSRSQWCAPAVASRCVTASSYWLRAGCGTASASAAANVTASCRRTPRFTGETGTSTANRTTAGPERDSSEFRVKFPRSSSSSSHLFSFCSGCLQEVSALAASSQSLLPLWSWGLASWPSILTASPARSEFSFIRNVMTWCVIRGHEATWVCVVIS